MILSVALAAMLHEALPSRRNEVLEATLVVMYVMAYVTIVFTPSFLADLGPLIDPGLAGLLACVMSMTVRH